MANPTFNVSDDDKGAILRQLIPQLFSALQSVSDEQGFTGDDVIDVFATGIALIIDNDSHLTALSHLREAAESAKAHIVRRTRDLREGRDGGPSSLSLMLAGGMPAAH